MVPVLSDGLGFGADTRTALIVGLVELQRLGIVAGADAKTGMGMAGLERSGADLLIISPQPIGLVWL